MGRLERLHWFDDEPGRLQSELDAMPLVAPRLEWMGTHWSGTLPLWPFDRPEPPSLRGYVGDRRILVEVHYYESFPMVAPIFIPINPEPEIAVRTMQIWHVCGDGSLCLFQNFTDWHPASTAAELVPKAAGWFLEYLLMVDGLIDRMTVEGLAHNDAHDHLFVRAER